jgi:Lipocalin-like domain
MKKVNGFLLALFGVLLFLSVISCSKSNGNSSAINVTNISGTYLLTDITVTLPPAPPFSVLDSIPPCQRDDLIKLNSNMSVYFVDAGTPCAPPSNDTSTWALSGSNITIDTLSGTISKFDGHVLQINSTLNFMGLSVQSTETLTKQ